MAVLVSASGTRAQVPDHLVSLLKKRGYKEVGATEVAPAPSPVSGPETAPKRRTRKPRVTDPES